MEKQKTKNCFIVVDDTAHYNATTVLPPFFRDHPGEPEPEENFWTLWCKGRLTEADTPTIRLGATPPSGLTNANLHHPPIFFTGQMPFMPPNQQRQNTEGSAHILIVELIITDNGNSRVFIAERQNKLLYLSKRPKSETLV